MSKFTDKIAAFGWTRATALAVIAAVAAWRILPHLPNLTPVGAMFVLGGLYLGRRGPLWMAAPFAALLVSDTVLNMAYDGRALHLERIADYAAFGLIAVAAHAASRRSLGWKVAVVVGAPVTFFLLSNLGVWAFGGSLPGLPAYPHNAAGLAACFEAALPFFRGTLFGDWLFAGAGVLMLEGLKSREAKPAFA